MSAVTVAPPVPHWQKGVQVRQRQERGRGAAALHDPNAWTVGIVVATGLALIARHPIARALGTEAATPRPDVQSSAPPVAGRGLARVPSLSLPVAPAPTHAPRDPFRALITAGGKVLAPVSSAVSAPHPAGAAPAATSTASGTGCAGATHRVAAGDTLWAIAASAVHSDDAGRVAVAWHRLYDANRRLVGSDPSLLRVGTSLCVPSALSRR